MTDVHCESRDREEISNVDSASVRVEPKGEADGRTLSQNGFYDPLSGTKNKVNEEKEKTQEPLVEFCSPSQLRDYPTPEGQRLVGDYHIDKGAPFVIGGPPGVGKSRAAVALAVAGATQTDWFGLKVHRPFKTMILQAENGRVRLKNEFQDISLRGLEDFVRVSPPPPMGFIFSNESFSEQLKKAVEDFLPDVFIVDPWNQLAKDAMERDYWDAFEKLQAVMPFGDVRPALGIVAHTRKPRLGERANGRSLINLISGSYVLTSVPRSVFAMQHVNDKPEDDCVVFTCCKNNDGELGARSAWRIRNGLFEPVEDLNWESFDNGGEMRKRKGVTEEHLNTVFQNGEVWLPQSDAAKKLMEVASVGRTAAYESVKEGGRFANVLVRGADGLFGIRV